jgi:hypothetical protein
MQSARESTLHISAICRKQIKWPTADLLGKCHWPSTVTLRGALSVIDLLFAFSGGNLHGCVRMVRFILRGMSYRALHLIER